MKNLETHQQTAEAVLDWLAGADIEHRHGEMDNYLPEGEIYERLVLPEGNASSLAQDLSIWRTRVRRVPRILTDADMRRAVAQNNTLSTTLGWGILFNAIHGWIFRFDPSPTAASFAQFVADWQQRRGLPVNGVLDYHTWFDMLCQAKNGIPLSFQTTEGITRPVGLSGIVATFGDPTQRGWENTNIQPVTAPSGREFRPSRTRLRVHRLLQPHFDRLFADIDRERMWDEITPTSGTFVCRTKSSHGKKPCGTPGIHFNQLSTHSWGITIDINADRYPRYSRARKRRNERLRYPPVTVTRVFQAHGFHWGLWFMKGELDANGRIDFTGADPHHLQFATGY